LWTTLGCPPSPSYGRQASRTLPGALWRLYRLREWVCGDAAGASADYAAGIRFADAPMWGGEWPPPGPGEMLDLADSILTGVFEGDLAIALERAAGLPVVRLAVSSAPTTPLPTLQMS